MHTTIARSALVGLIVFAGVTTWNRPARADLFVNRNVFASGIFTAGIELLPGKTYSFRTTALDSASADPVMHLWFNAAGREIAYNDNCAEVDPVDCSGGDTNSLIIYPQPFTVPVDYTVVVRASYPAVGGGGQVQWCEGSPLDSPPCVWNNLGPAAYFGGSRVEVASPAVGYFEYETSEVQLRMGGTDRTKLLGMHLDDATLQFHLVALDEGSGVGLMSRIGAGSGHPERITDLWVGTDGINGFTNVYTNDITLGGDDDGDGLGPRLEWALGTCNTAVCPDPYTPGHDYCCGKPKARLVDTDADGLDDRAEVFGIDAGFVQKLPAWGASPIHKDLFFQVDQHCIEPSPPTTPPTCKITPPGVDPTPQLPIFSEAMMKRFQAIYAEGTASDLQNFDSVDGVTVHFDVGTQDGGPFFGFRCADPLLCGNWGSGAQVVPCDSYDALGNCTPPALLDPARQHVFRRAFVIKETHPFDEGFVNDGVPPFKGGPHEMGHTLGLQHWGIDAWGGDGPAGQWKENCKPNYRSIMAYHTAPDPNVGFSKGPNGAPLDPSSTFEHGVPFDPTGIFLSSGGASYLAENSGLSTMNFPIATSVPPYDVDFNRDGLIDGGTSGFVRAGLAMGGAYAAQCVDGGAVERSRVLAGTPDPTTNLATITPDVAGFQGRLFAFWIAKCGGECADPSTNVIWYRSDISTGPNNKGSCSGGSGRFEETNCNTWDDTLNPRQRGPDPGVFRATGVAAMEWNGRLYVAWRTEDPAGTISVASAGSILPGGELVFDSSTTLPETGTDSESQIEMTPMYVKNMESGPGGAGGKGKKPPFGGASQVLSIFVLKHRTHEWAWMGPSGSWSTFRLVKDEAGNVINGGTAVAGVAVWPNRAPDWPDFSTFGFACGVFPQRIVPFPPVPGPLPPPTAHLLCYDKEIDRWHDLTSSALGALGGSVQISGRARPGIVFHTLRESGSIQPRPDDPAIPLGGDQTVGQFWISLLTPYGSGQTPQLLVSDRIDRSHPPGSSTKLRWVNNEFIGHPPDVGVPLYEDGDLSALKGLEYLDTGNPGRELWFIPFVDGTYGTEFRDGDDWLVIEGGICASLWSDEPDKCVPHWTF